MQQSLITYHLEDYCALVTGGSSGIGLATAKRLAESGCRVAINYLPNDKKAVQQIKELAQCGYDVHGFPHSIGDGQEHLLIDAVASKFGRLDLLVNNAGTPATTKAIDPKALDDVTDTMWNEVLDVNLVGLFRLSRAASPFLKEASGAIVNVASVSALSSRGSSMAYAASKAGVISLTRHMAIALVPQVRVNAVAPGAVDSTWKIEWSEEQRLSSIKKTPLGRRCSTNDIAETIVYLGVSAPMVTGQTLVIDGGLIL